MKFSELLPGDFFLLRKQFNWGWFVISRNEHFHVMFCFGDPKTLLTGEILTWLNKDYVISPDALIIRDGVNVNVR
jgi:hypothetical protein